jgi:predicted transposase/invertase (TIGR01784 family)
LQVNLAVFRAVFNPYLREELPALISLIFKLSTQRTGVEYIRTILYYLTEATQKVTREDLRAALLAQGADGERIMKTIAQEFIQEGIEKGLEQGRLEAKREIERIARILLKQHDAVTVSEITGLSLEEVQALQEE